MTTPYDRLASTLYGSRLLAQARLPREILRCLHQAQAASGLTVAEIAAATGDRRREVKQAFDGDGSIRPAALARYLHAMGYELELRLVPTGEPRRRLAEESAGGHGQGCGAQSQPQVRSWSTPPGLDWTLAQLETDQTPLPMPRPEPRYEPMMGAADVRAALDRLRPEDMDVANRQLREMGND